MAASIPPAANAEFMLDTYGAIALLNSSIKSFKKMPSGTPENILIHFKDIKAKWDHFRSTSNPEIEIHARAIDLTLGELQGRVEKLLKKFPLKILSSFASQPLSPDALEMDRLAKEMGFIPFVNTHSEALTACFGNFYECKIVFGGIHYLNAESAFQAQKYTDQPHVMARFEKTNGDAAVKIARDVPMLPTRVDEWDNLELANVNKVDIMMQVLRAKFGQNPHLMELLLATGNVYLVVDSPSPKNPDRFWADGYNGDGQNQLGICLMKLREEYGGMGVVPRAKQYIQRVCELLYQNDPDLFKAASKSYNCEQCKIKPKYYDDVMFYYHKYCSTNCVRMSRFDKPLISRCTHCKREPKFVGTSGIIHDYCGKICAGKAGYFMQ